MKHLLFGFIAIAGFLALSAEVIDLSGNWNIGFKDLKGEKDTTVVLPGSMLTNGLGNVPGVETKWTGSLYDMSYYHAPRFEKYRREGNIKFPFFLTPDREFVGTAVYSRKVEVPKSWKDTDITLFIERPHIETEVFINGVAAGKDSTLSVPHRFNVSRLVNPGETNEITVKVYNGIENVCVGQDSHSVTDQTQGNWNGMTGRIELQSRPKTHISRLKIFPDLGTKSVDVLLEIANPEKAADVTVSVDGTTKTYMSLPVDDGWTKLNFALGDSVRLWSEFTPELYELSAVLNNDTVTSTFGMRDISIRDKQFYLNGEPIWLRGTVENCNFPLTGYPPTDVDSWMKVMRQCKKYGLNHIRFHSYCPPEAAFIAADSVGIYLQPEGPSWPNHGVKLGNGMTIDRYLLEETIRMVDEYGNHPSFTMLAAGNEPAGNWVKWVGDFVEYWKSTGDDRRVTCGASVGGGWAWDPKSQYHVKGGARGLDWNKHRPGSADDFASDMEKVVQKGRTETLVFDLKEPRVAHEAGQWCVFPDFGEIEEYTGPYKARNFEIFRETLAENGMDDRQDEFLDASGKLQQLAYKYEIERNLRTPDYAGFQILGLNDYSGQGTALVGVLNVFWDEKPYTDTSYWQSFCAPVVPLARFPKFVFTDSERMIVAIELYNASALMENVPVGVEIVGPDGKIEKISSFTGSYPTGKNLTVDSVNIDLSGKKMGKYTLTVTVGDRGKNSWDFWVYPSDEAGVAGTEEIYVTDTLDSKAEEVLRNGGDVLIAAAGKVRYGNDIVQHYLPVFWNTSWFKMRPPHTTGASIDTSHPVFEEFPTDSWTNLNWWELVNKAQVMNLGQFPKDYVPPFQPIDTWHLNRKLGMIIEGKMYNGRLLMTTFDIDSKLDSRPAARQLRKSILNYMSGDNFNPLLELDRDLILNLFENEAEPVNMYTNDSPDELKPVLK